MAREQVVSTATAATSSEVRPAKLFTNGRSQAVRLPKPLRFDLNRAGTRIGAMDQLIAAQAVTYGLVVVTNNLREFRRVPGLRVENWLA
jgi:hypothetical protein